VPYFKILSEWIFQGIINDPNNEFQIEEKPLEKESLNKEITNRYWESRYKTFY